MQTDALRSFSKLVCTGTPGLEALKEDPIEDDEF